MGWLNAYSSVASPLVSMAPYMAPLNFYVDNPECSVVTIAKMS